MRANVRFNIFKKMPGGEFVLVAYFDRSCAWYSESEKEDRVERFKEYLFRAHEGGLITSEAGAHTFDLTDGEYLMCVAGGGAFFAHYKITSSNLTVEPIQA